MVINVLTAVISRCLFQLHKCYCQVFVNSCCTKFILIKFTFKTGAGNASEDPEIVSEKREFTRSASCEDFKKIFPFEDSKSGFSIPEGFSPFASKAYEEINYENFPGKTDLIF